MEHDENRFIFVAFQSERMKKACERIGEHRVRHCMPSATLTHYNSTMETPSDSNSIMIH